VLALALAVLPSAQNSAASTGVEAEPNDTIETATPIELNSWLTATFDPSPDVDFYSFNATSPGIFTIEVFAVDRRLPNVTATIIDAQGRELATATNNGNESVDTRVAVQISAPGTYFARVVPNGTTSWGGWYSVRALPQFDQGLRWNGIENPVHEGEPNGAWHLAEPIGLGPDQALFRRVAAPSDGNYNIAAGDVDFFHFRAPAAGTYTIEVFDVSGDSKPYTRLATFGPGGAPLWASPSTSYADAGVPVRGQIDVPGPGTYFFSVSNPSYPVSYHARVLPPSAELGMSWDRFGEPNGALDTARPLPVGVMYPSALDQPPAEYDTFMTDQDFYRFEAVAGQTYEVVVDSPAIVDVTLYDQSRGLITTQESAGGPVAMTATTSGAHYVRVGDRYLVRTTYDICVRQSGTSCVGSIDRLAGTDRYATAAQVSAQVPRGVPVAFLAAGTNFPDALAGSALAARLGGPVILVPRDGLPASVRTELTRLMPRSVVLLGSSAVISDATLEAARDYARGGMTEVRRIAGADRYDTAARISAEFPAGVDVAYVATGTNFPDALSGVALAARTGSPMLLTARDTIPPAVAAELTRLRPQRVIVLGSESVVSSAVATSLARYATSDTADEVTRIAGPDRFATSAQVASRFPAGVRRAYVATGMNFPDALAGAALAARSGGPVMLVHGDRLPAVVSHELDRLRPRYISVLGSQSVVPSSIESELGGYVR
jgi:putative cell wall-binding protein